jgi:TatD DNase family protein
MKLFDAHCHLQMAQYDADREAVLARMQEAGMGAVVIGVDYESSKAGLELAKQHDFLWASVGLHPIDNKHEQFDISNYEELARDPKVVAIGECGLDYFSLARKAIAEGSGGMDEEQAAQKERFEQQIALAQKVSKALIIHCRNAHDECVSVLQNTAIANEVPVVIHFFTGPAELASRYLDLGCYLSFPGPVTFTDMYDESIRVCPMDKVLIETDAPFAAPAPYRGKRNEPLYVRHVAEKVALLKGISLDEVCAQTAATAQKVFGLRP